MKKDKFDSSVAQTLEAGENFINGVKNPWFVIVLLFMIGGGFILYKSTFLICNSIDNLSSKMETLIQKNLEQTLILKSIDENIKKQSN